MEQKPENNMEKKSSEIKHNKPPRLWKEGCPEEKDYQEWRKSKLHSGSKHL